MEEQAQSLGPEPPIISHRGPASVDALLQSICRAPDQEAEDFIEAIYAERRKAADNSR